ncbi:MAG: tetratricopeptide repeat protein, partial [Thermoguttaceae bacterium]
AQQQLAKASGKEVAGSMALHSLGKLYEELGKGHVDSMKGAAQKAMVFYQASLLVFPKNYMSANDLGVLLARNEKFEDARKMLIYSLAICKQSTTWNNLAKVYGYLGRQDKAMEARQQAVLTARAEQSRRKRTLLPSGQQIVWVDESAFGKSGGNVSGIQRGPQLAGRPPNVPSMLPRESMTARKALPSSGILQPKNNLFSSADNATRPIPKTTTRDLPAMQPVTTGLLPNTSGQNRR